MNDPVRLRHAGSEAPEGLRELLKKAEPTRNMTEAEKAGCLAHVERKFGETGGTTRSPFALTIFPRTKYVGYGLVAVLAGATLIFGMNNNCACRCEPLPEPTNHSSIPRNATEQEVALPQLKHSSPQAPTRLPSAPATGHVSPMSASNPVRSTNEPDRNPTARAAQSFDWPQDSKETPDSVQRLTHQDAVLLLAEAQRYLDEQNPIAALARIDGQVKAYPSMSMYTDGELMAMDALMALGRKDEAHARGEALLKNNRGTPEEQRAEQKLEEIDKRAVIGNDRTPGRIDQYDIIMLPIDERVYSYSEDSKALLWLHGVNRWQFDANILMPMGINKTYRAIVFGDFDKDGLIDMAAVTQNAQAAWRGLEGGKFGAPVIAGSDMQVEIDDPQDDNARIPDQVGAGKVQAAEDPVRRHLELQYGNAVAPDLFEHLDVFGVEWMLNPM